MLFNKYTGRQLPFSETCSLARLNAEVVIGKINRFGYYRVEAGLGFVSPILNLFFLGLVKFTLRF